MDKIFVAGCSFSDWSQVEYNYGEYLGQALDCPVEFYTSGCGSNYRIWRKLVPAITNREITENDLLLIQYTSPERKEFWSSFESSIPGDYSCQGHPEKGSPMREKYGDGETIKYKVHAHSWQPNSEEKTFFKLYEENFVSIPFEIELFNTYHTMFKGLLHEYKIPTIFLHTTYAYNLPLSELTSPYQYYLDIKYLQTPDLCFEKDTRSHLTAEGHQKLANILQEYIKTNL
jgi:hypothetical protein